MILGINSNAQIGNLKDVKGKISSKTGKSKTENSTTTVDEKSETVTETTTSSTVKSSASNLESGKGYFYTSFKPDGFKTEVNIGNELYVKMQLGKTMIELAQEKGLQVTSWAYGYITVYIDGNKSFVFGPISFDSRVTKGWLYMDIPLNVKPDFIEKISADQSMLSTDQDIWVFQQLFQENSIMKKYTTTAMKQMTTGNHVVKVELGLSSSESNKEPEVIIASGEVKVVADAAGSKELAMNGPKHLRPLEANEVGKIVYNTNTWVPGMSELSFKMQIPNPVKYYNMKWCKANTCDYDHGSILFYASIDGEPLAAWSTVLWGADYDTKKDFEMVVLPLTDAGYGSDDAPFNKSILYKNAISPVVYGLLDMLYGGQLAVGNHKLMIKMYSQECVPYDVSYELQNSYFIQWPSIAESTIEINVTQEGLNKLSNSSCATKLTHATGEWVAV
ncbi:MAG: hypothetical protein CVU05_15210, partial [Bacteroidetes bacterium HGW-Bacteroidetes-21]